jgi:hypothetical protein
MDLLRCGQDEPRPYKKAGDPAGMARVVGRSIVGLHAADLMKACLPCDAMGVGGWVGGWVGPLWNS